MKHLELAKYIDHTLLNPSATPNDILTICEEAKHYKTASVCVNSCYVPLASGLILSISSSPLYPAKQLSLLLSVHIKKDRLDAVFFDMIFY